MHMIKITINILTNYNIAKIFYCEKMKKLPKKVENTVQQSRHPAM